MPVVDRGHAQPTQTREPARRARAPRCSRMTQPRGGAAPPRMCASASSASASTHKRPSASRAAPPRRRACPAAPGLPGTSSACSVRSAGSAPGNSASGSRCFHGACCSLCVRSSSIERARALDGASGARMSSASACRCGKRTSCRRACGLKDESCTASVRLWHAGVPGDVSCEEEKSEGVGGKDTSRNGELRKTREN